MAATVAATIASFKNHGKFLGSTGSAADLCSGCLLLWLSAIDTSQITTLYQGALRLRVQDEYFNRRDQIDKPIPSAEIVREPTRRDLSEGP